MKVSNHRINEIWYKQTSNLSHGTISPTFVVTHFTTGWSGVDNRNWLLGKAGGTDNKLTSAHVVIDRDGTAWQIAPFNRRAWHANPSLYGSTTDINSHAIGLEFQNPGWMKSDGRGGWVDYYGRRKTTQELEDFGGFMEASHPRVGSGTFAWPLFTPEQITTGLAIVRTLAQQYQIRSVVTHEEIDTRGWKTDPGPAFQQQAFIDLIGDGESQVEPPLYQVSATRLNLRGGPGNEYEPMDPPSHLPKDTKVQILRQEGAWAFIEVKSVSAPIEGLMEGLRGWVHRSYLSLQM